MFKQLLITAIIIFTFTAATASALSVYMPIQGGTGNSSIPTYGKLLVGNSSGTYTLTATSSLGIVATVGPDYITYTSATTSLKTLLGLANATSTLFTFTTGWGTTLYSNVTGNLTGNADTATALAANPTDCGASEFANAIAANGNLTCAVPASAPDGDFTWATNYNAITAATSSALWVQGNLYASSTSYLGTIAAGVWNGTAIANANLANSTIALTSSGSITIGTSPISLGGTSALNLNMANANTWTGLQSFSNATSTLLTFTKAWGNVIGNLTGNADTATALTDFNTPFNTQFGTKNLNDLNDVATTTIVGNGTGDVLTWTGTVWTNSNLSTLAITGLTDFYLDNTDMDIVGYKKLQNRATSSAETTVATTTTAGGWILLHSFITASSSPGITLIPGGSWHFVMYAKTSNTAGNNFLVTKIYKKIETGTETLLFTSTSSELTTSQAVAQEDDKVISDITLLETDRIVMKYYAYSTLAGHTITMYYQGTDAYTHVHTSIAVAHNQLFGLQGGSADQYYHSTLSEYTGTGTGNFVRLASPTLTGLLTVPNASTTLISGKWVGTAIEDAYLTKTGDWTGTIDGNNFDGGAIGAGDMLYGSAAGTISELAKATDGNILSLVNGLPSWIATTTFAHLNAANAFTGSITFSGSGDITLPALSVDAGTYAAASIDGDDINANLAGRSLTLTAASPDTLDADAELYTRTWTYSIKATTTGSSVATTTTFASFRVPLASTITGVTGFCVGAASTTVALDERSNPDAAGTRIFQDVIGMVIGDSSATSSFSNASMAAGAWVNLDIIGYHVGVPEKCFLSVTATVDD